jgi:hypothetical protein
MEGRRVTYRRQQQTAGSRAGGQRCLVCDRTFWAAPLVWVYTAEGAPLRYAHIHHDGDFSPPEFGAVVTDQEPTR